MKQEQLKKLAEWYGYVYKETTDCQDGEIIRAYYLFDNSFPSWTIEDWQPHKDSNQLDMLREKMRRETNYKKKVVTFDYSEFIYADYFLDIKCNELLTSGISERSNENESDINAILNYIGV